MRVESSATHDFVSGHQGLQELGQKETEELGFVTRAVTRAHCSSGAPSTGLTGLSYIGSSTASVRPSHRPAIQFRRRQSDFPPPLFEGCTIESSPSRWTWTPCLEPAVWRRRLFSNRWIRLSPRSRARSWFVLRHRTDQPQGIGPRRKRSARCRTVATVSGQLLRRSRSPCDKKANTPYQRRSPRTPYRHVEPACNDTIEESSSADDVDARKKRPRASRGSRHSYSPRAHACYSCTASHSAHLNCSLFTCCSLRLKSRAAFVHRQSLTLGATLEEPSHGGYAAEGVGEAQKPGPAPREGDITEERTARRTRINEAGDAVPGSQDYSDNADHS